MDLMLNENAPGARYVVAGSDRNHLPLHDLVGMVERAAFQFLR